MKKIIILIILISLIGCSVTYIKGDSNEVQTRIDNKQKIDSIRKVKNNPEAPERW